MKVHELAKELDVQSKDIIAFLHEKGIEVKAAQSTIDDDAVASVRNKFSKKAAQKAEPAKEAPAKAEPAKAAPAAEAKPAATAGRKHGAFRSTCSDSSRTDHLHRQRNGS